MARSGEESCSQSSIGLEPVSFSPLIPHPQSWTEVPHYNMSLRQQRTHQPFVNWKFDVKCQIANISQKLQESLEEHPDTRVRGCDIAWRPAVDHRKDRRRADADLPLYQAQAQPFASGGPPPPSKEDTEGFYRANSTEDPSYALSFGLGKRTITR